MTPFKDTTCNKLKNISLLKELMTKEGKEQDGQNGQEVDEFPKITNYIRTKVSMEIVQKSNYFHNLLV